jgi:hypothetical protein
MLYTNLSIFCVETLSFSLFFRLPTKVTIDRSSIREPNSLGSSARNPAAYVTGYGGVVDVAH